MVKRTLVSAIIVTRDRKKDLLECVDSISKSSYRPIEITVIDNNSKTPVASWLKKSYPKVKIIRTNENIGAAAGRNMGIKNSKGDFYFFTDDDARIDKETINYLMEVFRKKKEVGIVQPIVLDKDKPDTLQGAGHGINLLTGRIYAWGVMEKNIGQYNEMREIPLAGGICLVKKSVIDKIGMFDEEYFIPYEDSDLCQRAQKAGFKIYCYGRAKSWHQGKKSTFVNSKLEWLGITTPERAYRVARNKIIYMKKNAPFLNVVFFTAVLLPVYAILHSLIILSSKRVDIFSQYWKGVISGLDYLLIRNLLDLKNFLNYRNIDKKLYPLKLQLDARIDPICKIINKEGESILDVGCGQGYPMKLIKLVMKPKDIVGVDLFTKYIKEAKEEKIHDRYVISDIRKMKFAPKSFDIVLASQVIEHLPKKDGLKFIRDLEKIARKQVIIATPIDEMYHPAVDDNTLQLHLSSYNPKDFKKLNYQTIKFGRKSMLGENGLVHTVKVDAIKKGVFVLNILLGPIFYLFQPLADYYFVAYKDLKK